jgi:hypothetical protein
LSSKNNAGLPIKGIGIHVVDEIVELLDAIVAVWCEHCLKV